MSTQEPIEVPERMRQSRARQEDPSTEALGALLSDVQKEIDQPPGLRRRLQELPTLTRLMLLFGLIDLVLLVVLFTPMRRVDLQGEQWLVAGGAAVLLVMASVQGLKLALRGPHEPPVGLAGRLLVGSMLLLPAALALGAGALPGSPDWPFDWHVHCFRYALVLSGAVTGLAVLLQRLDSPPMPRVLSAAAAGGLMGFATLLLHCPYNDPGHLFMGHALPGLIVALVAVGVGWLLGRRGAASAL